MPNAENIDSRILAYPDIARQEEERQAAQLRQERSQALNSDIEEPQAEDNMSLRQRVFALKKAMRKREEKESKVKARAEAPVRMGANYLLRSAWTSLIPSWGFSLVWINIHVFMHFVMPDIFCKLGREWLPRSAQAAGSGKTAGSAIGIGEWFALFTLDFIAFAIIIAFFGLAVMVIDFLSANWLEKGFMLLRLGWDGIKALVDIFFII